MLGWTGRELVTSFFLGDALEQACGSSTSQLTGLYIILC